VGGFSFCLAGRFFALWGFFFLRGRLDICGGAFGGSQAIFGGSLLVFSVWCCVLFVGFAFAMLCNDSNFACVAFCGCWWYSL
jgi:hypothetical protein